MQQSYDRTNHLRHICVECVDQIARGATVRKPKGWVHRYEIIRRPVTFHPDKPPRDEWCIVHYFGRDSGAGVRYMGTGNPDLTDEYLIRRSGCDSVTVPVYVIRDGVTSQPYFGKYYGQK